MIAVVMAPIFRGSHGAWRNLANGSLCGLASPFKFAKQSRFMETRKSGQKETANRLAACVPRRKPIQVTGLKEGERGAAVVMVKTPERTEFPVARTSYPGPSRPPAGSPRTNRIFRFGQVADHQPLSFFPCLGLMPSKLPNPPAPQEHRQEPVFTDLQDGSMIGGGERGEGPRAFDGTRDFQRLGGDA